MKIVIESTKSHLKIYSHGLFMPLSPQLFTQTFETLNYHARDKEDGFYKLLWPFYILNKFASKRWQIETSLAINPRNSLSCTSLQTT